nr:hypothetical protein CFP56_56725 [Quercus suber]
MREELGREVVVGDGGVVGREVVALKAKWADPDLGDEVDNGEGVENGATYAATEREVREEGDVQKRYDWRVDGRDWDDVV